MTRPDTDRLHLAFYGRYSTDMQSDTSIEDQLRRCKDWATRNGHSIVLLFEDRAVSGSAVRNREGFQQLMETALSDDVPFNGIIVDDLSRLSRDVADIHHYLKRLRFRGIRVISVVDGIDTAEKPAKVQVAVKALFNEVYLDHLRDQTKRGLDGRFVRGLSTGGRIFGYKSVPIDRVNLQAGSRRVIDPEEAEIVRHIFDRFIRGESEKTIAKSLNVSRLGGKRWSPNVIWHMLQNEAYTGRFTFNKKEWIKNPDTGRRVYRERPPNEWLVAELPELRIIDDAVWEAAQERVERRRKANPNKRAASKGDSLLSGFLFCHCGRRLTLHGIKYACPANFEQGICENTVRFRRDAIEGLVLRAVRERLLPAIEAIEEEVNHIASSQDEYEAQVEKIRKEVKGLETSIRNRVRNMTALEMDPEDVRLIQEILREERSRLATLQETLEKVERSFHPISIDRGLILQALDNLDTVLSQDPLLGKEFLAGLIDRVVISPLSSDDEEPAKLRCPVCGRVQGKITPQHAARHDMTVEELMRRYPHLGVNQPVRVRIFPNIKNLLPEEEVVYEMVAGAGFEPATFGL